MKISEINIDRFGVWRNLNLPLSSHGFSAFYGPNEAGKTTLMRFIRGVLYGFTPRSAEAADSSLGKMPMFGHLVVDDAGIRHPIRRVAIGASRGDLAVVGQAPDHAAGELLDSLLKGINEQAFEHVFAIGLRELQELATLSDEDVARHIYGLTLGTEGRHLLEVSRKAQAERQRLIDPLQDRGRLVELFADYDRLTAELRSVGDVKQQHSRLAARKGDLEAVIADLKRRQSGIASQLRGHQFVERVWGPWNRMRECSDELQSLPILADFPAQGLDRLDRLDADIAAAAEHRDRLHVEVRQLRKQLRKQAQQAGNWKYAACMQGCVDQRAWLLELEERSISAGRRVDETELQFEAVREQLGPDWTVGRVDSADTSAVSHQRLAGIARSYQMALTRRTSVKRARKRLATAVQQQTAIVAGRLEELGAASVTDALSAAHERLDQLKDLARLGLHIEELQERQAGIDQHIARVSPRATLPNWVYVILGVFCFSGILLAGGGLITGILHSGIAGATYALLALTCGGLAWGLKAQFEGDIRERLIQLYAESDENLAELASARETLRLMNGNAQPLAGASAETPATSEKDLIRKASDSIAELEHLARAEQRLKRTTRKLAQMRHRQEISQREVATAGRTWRELLDQRGLPESMGVNHALETWQVLVEAVARLRDWQAANRNLEQVRDLWNGYAQRVKELGHRMQAWDLDYRNPLAILDLWERQLAARSQQRKNQAGCELEIRKRLREAAEYENMVDDLKRQRNALLIQGGASDRDTFESRARAAARRTYLEDQHFDASQALDSIASEEPDLALVEEDLESYDPAQNRQCIDMLEREQVDLERDLEQAFEDLGSTRHELQSLENDRRPTQLRYDLAQVTDALRNAASHWFAVESATHAIDALRSRVERTRQPGTLSQASKFLARMTCGKYRNVWTPLGKRQLRVDDEYGLSQPVECLSCGTREQLFLAVRLAVVQDLARQGIVLPMILDDIIVNFDEQRAEAAVDLLLEFAAEGHQILFFTCHLHLAQALQRKGIEPNWLPAHSLPLAEVGEQRLAG